MSSRQRGAVLVFTVLVLGRLLDRFDLPFESSPQRNGMPADSTLVPGGPGAGPRRDSTLQDVAAGPAAPAAAVVTADTARSSRRHRDAATAPAVVRVNHATAQELQRLPGVGPVLAGRIFEHRRTHGVFRDLADLRHVKGIGARTAERLSSWIRFD